MNKNLRKEERILRTSKRVRGSHMITVNQEKCIGCRQCERICHTNSIRINKNEILIDKFLCSTCTQCIAVCPVQALSWNNIEPQNINSDMLPKPEQIKEFFKQRRTVRKFKDKPIERRLLEDIAIMSKYAPTNNYSIDVIIIDEPYLINQLEEECIKFIKRMYSIFYKYKIVFNLMRKITPAMNIIDKIKTERTLKRGSIFQSAPALIILIADKRIPHTELSTQYSLYNMALYSQTLGLGSCISGAGKMILSRNKRIRKLLNLSTNKDVQGILFLGYRDVNFKNKVEGIRPQIQWNSNNEI